ncbi:MAG: MerR family transcriptional regulator [Candidatus Dormibacteraeota bacterium]|nr:MerR family transcriptional regulator [Candidatus Dormibacteraeota bacterium]
MGTVLSIGDFSRMTHLSVKALRHYHDVGVLEPAHIDRFTGYRSYDPAQVSTAQIIRRLRALQMPLDQIRSVLNAPDLASRNREIAAHLARMERQLEDTQASVAALRNLLESPPAAPSVTFRRIPRAMALAVEAIVDASGAPAWGSRAFALIEAARERLGLAAAGAPGALFPGDFFELERARLTAFVPVAVAPEEPLPALQEGPVRWHEIPALDAAVAVHEGPLSEIDRTYGALGTAVAQRAIGVEGPVREYFVVGGRGWEDSERRTEVCWPVFLTGVKDLS